MCSECLHTPLYICTECGGGILEGDMYLRVGADILCQSCIDDLVKEA